MKINHLEAHDRLLHLKQDQSVNLNQGAEDCLKKNPDSLALQAHSPYIYIYAHPRTADDGYTKRMLWQPRLGRPKPQTNSYLFRAQSNTDIIEICWLIPPREQWSQYEKGKVTEDNLTAWSIDQFTNNREELSKPYSDDLSETQIRNIWIEIARDKESEMKSNKFTKLKTSEAS